LAAVAEAGAACLGATGLLVEEVGALLVTSEAPPLLAGLAAALHHRLGLRPQTPALEVGGACCGFLAALWLARVLVSSVETVQVLAVEAPSRHLAVEPGDAGENAALFGDGAAACVVSRERQGRGGLPLLAVGLSANGGAGHLLRVEGSGRDGVGVRMDGRGLASRAVDAMAGAVREVVHEHGLTLEGLAGVVVHGGNGRMPALAARRLGLPAERVWSRTSESGNLGAASLLAAWEAYHSQMSGPVAWAGVGAGLTVGWALTGPVFSC
jgi:3-oxoacyl-[acyl-carrier-protein] synthase-3